MLQLSPQPSEAALADHAEAATRTAAAQGADVVVMPEMMNVGYCHLCPSEPGHSDANIRALYEWTNRAQRCDFTTASVDGRVEMCGSVNGSVFVRRFALLAKELNVAIQVNHFQLQQ